MWISSEEYLKNMGGNISLEINRIEQSLRNVTNTLQPLSDKCCIYKVPPSIRELHKAQFTPQIVSIGPFHHGKMELKSMEEHKYRYLKAFLERVNMTLAQYIEGLKQHEKRLRESYVEINGFSTEEFMKMMAVDGAFVMEFLLRYYDGPWPLDDRIFGRQRLCTDVREDLLLIENQLPFFYLEHLFQLYKENESQGGETLTLKQTLKDVLLQIVTIWESFTTDDIAQSREVHHLLHFLIICLKQSQMPDRTSCTSMSTPTISKLHRAGVKFNPSSSHCLSTIKFADGIMEIPKIKLTGDAEKILRNMQAFEHCHRLDIYVGDYIHMMDGLINGEEDMKELVQSGIVENWLEDHRAAAAVFHDLNKGNVIDSGGYSYTQVVKDLNAYCENNCNLWKASFKQKYFSNPWAGISVVAASALLLLTIVQAVCSILQVVWM